MFIQVHNHRDNNALILINIDKIEYVEKVKDSCIIFFANSYSVETYETYEQVRSMLDQSRSVLTTNDVNKLR